MNAYEVAAWNAALEAAADIEARQGFRVTAERIRSLKKAHVQSIPAYFNPVCRGSFALGSACGRCERCEQESNRK